MNDQSGVPGSAGTPDSITLNLAEKVSLDGKSSQHHQHLPAPPCTMAPAVIAPTPIILS